MFISYSRRDTSEYAMALAAEMTAAGLSCFLDQWGTRPGRELPDDVITSLRRSTVLILLGSPGDTDSESVAKRSTCSSKQGGR